MTSRGRFSPDWTLDEPAQSMSYVSLPYHIAHLTSSWLSPIAKRAGHVKTPSPTKTRKRYKLSFINSFSVDAYYSRVTMALSDDEEPSPSAYVPDSRI